MRYLKIFARCSKDRDGRFKRTDSGNGGAAAVLQSGAYCGGSGYGFHQRFQLIQPDAVEALTRELFPLAQLVTPNIPEAELLSGRTIADRNDMELAAEHIGKAYGCAVLLKGGHSVQDADDLLYADGRTEWFAGKRIDTSNTHGTGCTLSSAIASNLAKGFSLRESVKRSKEYLSGALSAG